MKKKIATGVFDKAKITWKNHEVKVDLIILVILALATRLHKLCVPDTVCWDETHFGKFASFYLRGENYFDVHPPLGKMMLAAFGFVTGYNGSFAFSEPGEEYADTPFCGMRACCALLGAAIIPFIYIATTLNVSRLAGRISGLLLVFDTGLITLTQFILLEAPLFFFLSATVLSYTVLRKFEKYSRKWYVSLALVGVSIGCVMSVKYIGFFVVLYTGFQVIEDIWVHASNRDVSLLQVMKLTLIYAASLILLPLILYLMFFVFHFHFTSMSTDADSAYSPRFQASLKNSKVADIINAKHLKYSNTVRFSTSKSILLHSHHLQYPDINQNQVTGYSHRDANNLWVVKPCEDADDVSRVILSGDVIRLQHVQTNRFLSVVTNPGIMDTTHFRVITVEHPDFNSCFQVRTQNHEIASKISPFEDVVSFTSLSKRCVLSMGSEILPEYAGKQLEVSCSRHLVNMPASAHFTLEHNVAVDPSFNTESVKPAGLVAKYLEMQVKMLESNNGLIPKEGEATSRPWMWPIDYDGIFFAIHKVHGAVYFLGNPIVFFVNLVGILFLLLLDLSQYYHVICYGTCLWSRDTLSQANWFLLGYLLHYIPFFLMGRVLYFHHFYSAFIFNTMVTGSVVAMVTEKLNHVMHHVVVGILGLLLAGSFFIYAPLSYGIPVDENKQTFGYLKDLKWYDSWQY